MNAIHNPGDAEYLGAVAGMRAVYGHPSQPDTAMRDGNLVFTYAVGQAIAWRDERGHIRRGVVVEVLTDTTYHVRSHIPDVGTQHFAVEESQTIPW